MIESPRFLDTQAMLQSSFLHSEQIESELDNGLITSSGEVYGRLDQLFEGIALQVLEITAGWHFAEESDQDTSVDEDSPYEQSDSSSEDPENNGQYYESRIDSKYDGLFSDQMVWNDEAIDSFIDAADLRTDITIVKGGALGSRKVENMGDTLAWKFIGNPMDLFSQTFGKGDALDVSVNLMTGKAEVKIHDQILYQEVKTVEDRRVEEAFVEEFNRLVKVGLNEVGVKEKSFLLSDSLYTSSVLVLSGVGVVGFGVFMKDFVTNVVKSIIHFGDLTPHITAGMLPSVSVFLVSSLLNMWLMDHMSVFDKNNRYYSSYQVLNPFKHLKDLVSMKANLATSGRSLVSLDEDSIDY